MSGGVPDAHAKITVGVCEREREREDEKNNRSSEADNPIYLIHDCMLISRHAHKFLEYATMIGTCQFRLSNYKQDSVGGERVGKN